MRLTPKKVRQLAINLNEKFKENGYNDTPNWEQINEFISQWVIIQYQKEGEEFYTKATSLTESLK